MLCAYYVFNVLINLLKFFYEHARVCVRNKHVFSAYIISESGFFFLCSDMVYLTGA